MERAELPESTAMCHRFLARRWAAKEAFAKALGTGIRGEVALNAIIVQHNELGQPYLNFSTVLAERMATRGLQAHLSLSDEKDYAVAFVVVEG